MRELDLITPLGVVEGEILSVLDEREKATVGELQMELDQPRSLVMMAAGALIREGLVRGIKQEADFVIVPNRSSHLS